MMTILGYRSDYVLTKKTLILTGELWSAYVGILEKNTPVILLDNIEWVPWPCDSSRESCYPGRPWLQ